jgi:DUF4097 and DUF4098 domain-containing protein YvlB
MGLSSPGWKLLVTAAAFCAVAAFAANTKKQEFRYNVGPGASVTIANPFGPVVIKGSPSHQVVITATPHSEKVEVDASQAGNRIEAVSHFLQHASAEEGQVEYQVTVPEDASVTVRASTGPVSAEGIHADLMLEGDAARLDVRDARDGLIHLRTVSGPINLTGVRNAHVEITSVSGDVQMTDVDGKKVAVNTTKGAIRYNGDFGSGGEYRLVNYSGDIDVIMPRTASVDLTARSRNGSVQKDFPLQQKAHTTFQVSPRAFAGTSNSGSSSVQLQSFSGTIRVKQQ